MLNGPKPLKTVPRRFKVRRRRCHGVTVDFTCLLQNKRGRAFVICAENPQKRTEISAFWVRPRRSPPPCCRTPNQTPLHTWLRASRHLVRFFGVCEHGMFPNLKLYWKGCLNQPVVVLTSSCVVLSFRTNKNASKTKYVCSGSC